MKRFIETLDSATLYFAAATQFHDPFEGAVAVQVGERDIDPRYAAMEPSENAFFEQGYRHLHHPRAYARGVPAIQAQSELWCGAADRRAG
jgi:hypothetical protein